MVSRTFPCTHQLQYDPNRTILRQSSYVVQHQHMPIKRTFILLLHKKKDLVGLHLVFFLLLYDFLMN